MDRSKVNPVFRCFVASRLLIHSSMKRQNSIENLRGGGFNQAIHALENLIFRFKTFQLQLIKQIRIGAFHFAAQQ